MSKHEIGCLNHCPRGGGNRLLAGIVAIVLLVAAIAAYHARRGVETGLHVVAVIGEIVMWIAAAGLLLSVAAGIGWVAWKIVQRVRPVRAPQVAAPPEPGQEPARRVIALGPPPQAIEPARSYPADCFTSPPEEVNDGDARTYSQFR